MKRQHYIARGKIRYKNIQLQIIIHLKLCLTEKLGWYISPGYIVSPQYVTDSSDRCFQESRFLVSVKPGEGDCHMDGTTYKTGDTFEDPADKCLMCECSMSAISCGVPGICPVVECLLPYLEEGGCCPVCPGNYKLYVPQFLL